MRITQFEETRDGPTITLRVRAVVSGQVLQVTRTGDTSYLQNDQIDMVSACLRRDAFKMLGQEVQNKLEQSMFGR